MQVKQFSEDLAEFMVCGPMSVAPAILTVSMSSRFWQLPQIVKVIGLQTLPQLINLSTAFLGSKHRFAVLFKFSQNKTTFLIFPTTTITQLKLIKSSKSLQ